MVVNGIVGHVGWRERMFSPTQMFRRTCACAAEYGYLNILKWARENGCEWNSDTCTYAAKNGHLETLKWARENGCPWNKKECLIVAKKYPSVVKWIKIQKD